MTEESRMFLAASHSKISPFTKLLVFMAFMATTQSTRADSIYSGTLDVFFSGCAQTQGIVGPVSATCSNAQGQGTGFANYTQMGVMGATSHTSFNSGADMYDTLTIGGVPAGTQVDLTFVTSYAGTYTFNSDGTGLGSDMIFPQVILAYNQGNNYIINGGQLLRLCGPGLVAEPGCTAYGAALAGSLEDTFTSTMVVATAGTGVPIHLEFFLALNAADSSTSADFLDPFTLSNILVTDPNTGQPIVGATITGASGTVYPVNVTSVPEPSAIVLAGLGITVLFVGRLRRAEFGSRLTSGNSPDGPTAKYPKARRGAVQAMKAKVCATSYLRKSCNRFAY